MKKLKIKPYTVEGMIRDPDSGQPTVAKMPYDVRKSIANVVLAPDRKLGMADLMRYSKITDKIEACKEDFILLEDADFEVIKRAFNEFKGFGQNEIKLCRRIEEVEDIEVKEVKKK